MRFVSLLVTGALGAALAAACSGDAFEVSATGGTSAKGGSGGKGGSGASDAAAGAAGSGGALTCTAPQEPCGGVCVNLTTNPSHCGACGNACSSGSCSAGQCVSVLCTPGEKQACYTGPTGTENVGICTGGQRTCDASGTSFGSCEGEVLPAPADDCTTADDDDCTGKANEGCVPVSCAAIKDADFGAQTGTHQIDPDGSGGAAPFDVHCDMTRVNGGWTRFNWLKGTYVAGQDPLGQALSECKPSDTSCRGRIPKSVQPKQLMVVDLTDKGHAVWDFDNANSTSKAALAALRDKVMTCQLNKMAWQPSIDVSGEGYCGKGSEGGCDSFYYSGGSCQNIGGWGLMLDGDGYYCQAAFKLGATSGGSCGKGDQGFLNDCDCNDEHGELYYR
jgi:hypothetical protein